MPLHRFGMGSRVYTFPNNISTYRDNFKSVVQRTVRLPGADGGFSEYARGVAPTEVGEVRQSFTLVSTTRSGMSALRDALNQIVGWGTQPLFLRPTNYPTLAERSCMAAVNDIQIGEEVDNYTDLHQPVTVIWQVADPRWLSVPSALSSIGIWGMNHTWGNGVETWGGGNDQEILAATSSLNITITNNGNANSYPRIYFKGISSLTPLLRTPIRIERVTDLGEVLQQVTYSGANIGAGDVLMIDPRAKRVWRNGANAYADFEHDTFDWLTLVPGANKFNFYYGTPGSSNFKYRILTWDAWY